MATRKKRQKKSSPNHPQATPEPENGAPSGRGGAAMGRTVGLPFGGARPRRRNSKATDGEVANRRDKPK